MYLGLRTFPFARCYLNQFIQPDTILPDPYQPWEWNRYMYSRNNPVLFTDPSGFLPLLRFERNEMETFNRKQVKANYWNDQEKIAAERAAFDVGLALAKTINANSDLLYAAVGMRLDDCSLPPFNPVSPTLAFLLVYKGSVTFMHIPKWSGSEINRGPYAQTQGRNLVYVFKDYTEDYAVEHPGWVVHELGHAFADAVSPTGKPWDSPTQLEMPTGLVTRNLNREDDPNRIDRYAGFAGAYEDWQYSPTESPWEVFSDMFLGWVYNTWARDVRGRLTPMAERRATHMNDNMDDYIMDALSH